MAPTPPKITIRREPSRLSRRALRLDRAQLLALVGTALVATVGAFAVWTVLSRPTTAEARAESSAQLPAGRPASRVALTSAGDVTPPPESSEVAQPSPTAITDQGPLLAACDVSPQRSLLDWIWNTGGVALIHNDAGSPILVADPVRWRSPEPLLSPGELPPGPVSIRGIRLPGLVSDDQLRRCLDAAPDLEALSATADELGVASIIGLRNLAQLRDVSLTGLTATRLEMELIAEIPALRRLHLVRAQLPGDALEGLAACEQLNELCLAEAAFAPRQLASLQRLPSLTQLDLRRTHLDQASLQELALLKPLRRLQLEDAGLDAQALDALRVALPQCEVCPTDEERHDPSDALWPQLTLSVAP